MGLSDVDKRVRRTVKHVIGRGNRAVLIADDGELDRAASQAHWIARQVGRHVQ